MTSIKKRPAKGFGSRCAKSQIKALSKNKGVAFSYDFAEFLQSQYREDIKRDVFENLSNQSLEDFIKTSFRLLSFRNEDELIVVDFGCWHFRAFYCPGREGNLSWDSRWEFEIAVQYGADNRHFNPYVIQNNIQRWYGEDGYRTWKKKVLGEQSMEDLCVVLKLAKELIPETCRSVVCCDRSEKFLKSVGIPVRSKIAYLVPDSSY